jgi:hypothetical protein
MLGVFENLQKATINSSCSYVRLSVCLYACMEQLGVQRPRAAELKWHKTERPNEYFKLKNWFSAINIF